MRLLRSLLLLLCAALLASCTALPTRTPAWATITAALDLGTGGSDWVATIYAQEVHTGKTFHTVMSAGGHGLVVLPTSPPVTFNVEAPGTYIFYAVLINSDDYHWGSTGCPAGTNCKTDGLVARDVLPGGVYYVTITDQSAKLPPTGVPVTVPWHK